MHILIVKTSSLGDVVHALPALTDATSALPGLRADWLIERPFAEIPSWHPAVDRVIPCNLRGWRKAPLSAATRQQWRDFRQALAVRRYDCIIDAQGLFKSAWLATLARGPRAGADRHSAREPLASFLYQQRYRVPRHDQAHAIERTRRLFSAALGYPLPDLIAPPDAGLERDRFPRPADAGANDILLLHGTTWPSKRWPLSQWCALAQALSQLGLRPVLPWGNADERAVAEAIATASDGLVLPKLGLSALAGWLANARGVVGVDTGLMHLAAALAVPGVSLYGPTLPQLTGAWGQRQTWLWNTTATTIDRDRPLAIETNAVLSALLAAIG